ncbi:MAG: hypothetical protein U0746_18710 [Gemmataceae bacterium]
MIFVGWAEFCEAHRDAAGAGWFPVGLAELGPPCGKKGNACLGACGRGSRPSRWRRRAWSDSTLTPAAARAAHGPAGDAAPRPLKLDPPHDELPMAVSLEKRTPEVGHAALALARKLPHLTAPAFLAALGQPRDWRAGRVRIDATGATALAADRIRAAVAGSPALGVAVPPYLTQQQVALAVAALEHAKLAVLGSIASPLAVAAVSPDRFRTALLVDADDHALTWTVLTAEGPQARAVATLPLPHLSAKVWLDRLLDATADRCVRLCRRDPRDSAAAEQYLYEQLIAALDRPPGLPVPLTIRTAHWYQELTLAADDLEAFGASLARKATDGLRAVLEQAHAASPKLDEPDLVWVTQSAARLPGLHSAIAAVAADAPVNVLPAEFVAAAAHALAGRWQRGELPRGHVDALVPRFAAKPSAANGLPAPPPAPPATANMNPLVRLRDSVRRPGQQP